MRLIPAIIFSSIMFSSASAQQTAPAPVTPAAAGTVTTANIQKPATKVTKSGLTVTRAVIARGIDENKRPVEPGTEFAADGKRVYCITQIEGAKQTVNIEHRWYKDDALVNTVELPVMSLNWRTQSYKTIPPALAGKWKVDVVLLPAEVVLTSVQFTAK